MVSHLPNIVVISSEPTMRLSIRHRVRWLDEINNDRLKTNWSFSNVELALIFFVGGLVKGIVKPCTS